MREIAPTVAMLVVPASALIGLGAHRRRHLQPEYIRVGILLNISVDSALSFGMHSAKWSALSLALALVVSSSALVSPSLVTRRLESGRVVLPVGRRVHGPMDFLEGRDASSNTIAIGDADAR